MKNISRTHDGNTVAGDWFLIDPAAGNDKKLVEAGTGIEFPSPCTALKVLGTGGTVQVVSETGQVIPWEVVTGDTIPLRAAGIRAEGTSATGIWGLY